MSEGTAASQWANAPPTSAAPARQASKDSNTSSHTRGPRNNTKGRRRGGAGGRKQSTANQTNPAAEATTETSSPTTAAPAAPPATEAAKSPDPPRMKLIDRLSMPPEAHAAPTASVKPDSPVQSDSKGARPRRDRAGSRRKAPASKANNPSSVSQQPAENKEPESADSHTTKDAPPHITSGLSPAPNGTSDLADKFKTLNLPSAPTTPRPYTPSAIDWAGDTEDGSLPDLDDWGVHAVKPEESVANKDENNKLNDQPAHSSAVAAAIESTAPHTDNKPSGNRRRDSKPREHGKNNNLLVPARGTTNGHSSSRPVTPSALSPSLRGRRRQEGIRASSRASFVNDPPNITVTSNNDETSPESPEDQEQAKSKTSPTSTTGLGLNLSETEPVFASLNDPPLPEPEEPHIRRISAPNTHGSRGARGRGGRGGRHSGGGPGMTLSPGFGQPGQIPMQMPPSPHIPSSPHMPPSSYMPPSPYGPNGNFAPHQGGYHMGPHFYGPQGQGFSGHQHSYSHPQPSQSPRGHQRSHSRPIITGSAISMITRNIQGGASPQKPKTDVSASS